MSRFLRFNRVNPCPVLEATITEDQFDISVSGNNPVRPQFQGSEGGHETHRTLTIKII